jgi:hypothetical protein
MANILFSRICACCILSLPLFTYTAGAETTEKQSISEPLVINNNHPEGTPAEVWMTKVYQDLYSRMNVPLKMVYYPKARGVFYADAGKIYGQVTSVFQYQEQQPDQVRIEFPLIRISMLAITQANRGLQIDSWDSL